MEKSRGAAGWVGAAPRMARRCSPGMPRRLGTFGGGLDRGGSLLGTRALGAVVGRDRLMAFDPVSRRATLIADGAGVDKFVGPPSLAPSGDLLVMTADGELLGI